MLISKKLRPLAERNVSNAQVHPAPEPESGAAVLAATKKALRPVTAGVKPEDREPIKVTDTTYLPCHIKQMTYEPDVRFARRIFVFGLTCQMIRPRKHPI